MRCSPSERGFFETIDLAEEQKNDISRLDHIKVTTRSWAVGIGLCNNEFKLPNVVRSIDFYSNRNLLLDRNGSQCWKIYFRY